MDLNLFKQLSNLMYQKDSYETAKKELEYINTHRKHHNYISLSKGLHMITLEPELVPILIDYFDKRIKETEELICEFTLRKDNIDGEKIEEEKKEIIGYINDMPIPEDSDQLG